MPPLDPISLGLTLAGGLFGGGQQRMSAAQQEALRQQQNIANQLYNYSQSSPLSNQQDLNSLAQAIGTFGQQERSNLGALSQFGNPDISTGGMGSLLAGIQSNDMANRESLTSQHLADAIAARRQALLQAAGANQAAFNMASTPGATPANPLAGTLGGLAQAYAYSQAQKGGGGGGGGVQTTNPNPNYTTSDTSAPFSAAPGVDPFSAAAYNQAYDNPQRGTLSAGTLATPTPGQGAPTFTPGGGMAEPPFAFQGAPSVGGGLLPPGMAGPTLPGGGGAFSGGAGDAPKHDPLAHGMMILHELIKAHLPAPKAKKKRKKKPTGSGDMPQMPPGMMGGGMPNSAQGAEAPGNEPGGQQTTNNQARRPAEAMLDRLRFPSGQVFPY